MGRTGYIEPWSDAAGKKHYRARIRLGDGSRTRIPIPDGYSEARAREFAAAMQEQEDEKGKLLAAKLGAMHAAPSVVQASDDGDRWFDAWEAERIRKGLTSTRDNRSHYYEHIRPALEAKHVRDWTTEDVRALVRSLDDKVRGGALEWKTAINAWGTAKKMCADAVSSKLDTLRVRPLDPSATVEGPDRGDEKSKPFLFPSEFLALVSSEAVPLRWRQSVTLAIYLFPRDGEIRILRWEDGAIDLDHGTIHIHRAWERRARTVKATKMGRARRFNIEPALLPLLRQMRDAAGGTGLVLDMPSERDMARGLRRWLAKAGIARPELHTGTRTTKKLSWHDLRATGLTWMAVRGDEPLKIMQRAGHSNFATTQRYVRTAEAISDGFGEVFPPLPAALFGASTNEERTEDVSSIPSSWPTELAHRPGFFNDVGGADGTRKPYACETSGDRTEAAAPSVVAATPSERPHDRDLPVGLHGGPTNDDAIEDLTRTAAAASSAGEWDVVKAALEELRLLRLAQAGPNVVAIDAKVRGRR